MKNLKLLSLMVLFLITTLFSVAQTDCLTPHEITSVPFLATELTTIDAGNSYGADDACGSDALVNEEYVFYFTPTADMQINIALQNTAIVTDALLPMAEIGLFITELCPDDDLAVCVASNDELQANPTLENVNLTSGTTYFIIVSSANANFLGESPTNVNFDIEITENMAKDLGVIDVSGVISSCGLTDQETITCEIENFGYQSATNFDIGITINGSAAHVETFSETIEAGATANFTFTSLFDLSNVGEYIIEVFTDLNGDEYADNDNFEITIVNTPSHSLSSVSEVTEDFENGTAYWTVSGTNSSWELGTPNDTVTINYAASGENCWVTNLDGVANTGENSFLESPCYNLAALTLPTVEFNIWRTFGLFGNTGSLEASLDGGETWEEVIIEWTAASEEWEFVSVQMHDLVGQSNVRFRFNYNSGFMAGEGMAIDDFTITEAKLVDLGVIDLTTPMSSCGLTDQEAITIEIENFGALAQTDIPVNYSIDGGNTWLSSPEIINETIEAGETLVYTFTTLADMSAIGEYEIIAKTIVVDDEDADNDNFTVNIMSTPIISDFPSTVDFESGNAYWVTGGTLSSWELGTPNDTVDISYAASGENCWVTNLEGNANTNEISYLMSPCYDISSLNIPTVEFNIWRTFGIFGNSGSLVASLDGGETWVDTVANWAGSSNEWELTYIEMPQFQGETNVRFRFNYESGFLAGNGMAIDDFTVKEAVLNDVAVGNVLKPLSGCGLSDSELISAVIWNIGANDQENIPVNYSIDGGVTWLSSPEVIEETLSQGDSIVFTFAQTADLSTITDYEIHVRTELAGDENPDNDLNTLNVTNAETISDFDYAESFETGPAGWSAYGTNSSMELATPNAFTIIEAADGDFAWVTNAEGFANPSEVSYLQSPCFDFSELTNPVFKAMVQYETGMLSNFYLAYSVDQVQWDTIKAADAAINWYGDGLGGFMATWNGNSEGWINVSTNLPDLAGEPNVSFRFVYNRGAFSTGDNEGVAIDMIEIFECDELPTADFDFTVNALEVTFTNNSTNANSYLWEFNDNAFLPSTSEEESPVFSFPDVGTYNVKLIAYNDCGLDSITKVVEITTVNVNNNVAQQISVYPNPATNIVFVNNPNANNSTVKVLNISGQVLSIVKSNEQIIRVNISEFAEGSYFIQVINDNETKIFPIIIN